MSKKIKRHYIFGIVIILVNAYWMFSNIRLYLRYKNPDLLVNIMTPNWALALNIIFTMIGIGIGIAVISKKWNIRKGILNALALIIISMFTVTFFRMF